MKEGEEGSAMAMASGFTRIPEDEKSTFERERKNIFLVFFYVYCSWMDLASSAKTWTRTKFRLGRHVYFPPFALQSHLFVNSYIF